MLVRSSMSRTDLGWLLENLVHQVTGDAIVLDVQFRHDPPRIGPPVHG